ncbi:MAG: exosortase/archaeosortase family protein, partial [bacterium]
MKKRNIILFFLVTVLIAVSMYGPTLLKILKVVIHREGSSHGLFIPLLSFYFIWLKRSRLKEIEMRISLQGLILVAIGLLLYFLKIGDQRFYLQAFSFFILTSGLVFFFMGKKFFKEVAFPVLFLICMIPIPKEIYFAMAENVRYITLGTSAWALSLTNIPFLKENLVIHLPNVSLVVDLSCSGIRYLISFLVFGIAYAYLFRTRLFDRILLVCLTIPLSLSASVL